MSSRHAVLKARDSGIVPTEAVGQISRDRIGCPLVFVGSIPRQITRADVRAYLSSFGDLNYFSMPYYLYPDNHKGFAKVYFCSIEAAQAILRQETHTIKDLPIAVLPWVGKHKFVSRKEQPSAAKLFAKFSEPVPESDLLEYFEQFGRVERIEIKMNYKTKALRNFGFIIFQKASSAGKALSRSTLHVIKGKEVNLSPSKSANELSLKSKKSPMKPAQGYTDSLDPLTAKRSIGSSSDHSYERHPIETSFPVSSTIRGAVMTSRQHLHPVSYPAGPANHVTKPNSSQWHHHRVDSNHRDSENLLFKKVVRRNVVLPMRQ